MRNGQAQPRRAGRPRPSRPAVRGLRAAVGVGALAVAGGYLVVAGVDTEALRAALAAAAARPELLGLALAGYALAFALRAVVWSHVLPGLSVGQSWAALHVALAGNHVLPLRLGEALRVTSVLRRTALPAGPVTASALTLRLADLGTVLALAALSAPAVLGAVAGWWLAPAAVALSAAGVAAAGWVVRLRRRGAALRLPGAGVLALTAAAWLLESGVMWAAARAAGLSLGAGEAVAVTAVTIAAQTVAVTPGGVGSYEAAATAALVALGAAPGPALATAVVAHAAKTAYALATGLVALVVPSPGYLGRLRLPRRLPSRPVRSPVPDGAPVIALLPAHDEEATVAAVVAALPAQVAGRPLVALVVDDGSTDATAQRARDAGATVLTVRPNRGLGAAVRTGLAAASALGPAAVVYLDADGEYPPSHVDRLAEAVLSGRADYVVGSRFLGDSRRMRPHRTVGNRVLTAWVRWLTRRRDLTDGQSGMRAFSADAAAAAEVVHDYNYAQVLTLDLLGKGFAYAEVPIPYAFRTSGRSFVRLGRYLARVVPAVHRELNPPRQSSTTWPAKRSRAADHAAASQAPPTPSAAAAS